MFKKVLAQVSILSLVLLTVPVQLVSAADDDTLISSITLTSAGSGNVITEFNASGDDLKIAASVKSGALLGSLLIKRGTETVHTFTNMALPATWDGLCGTVPCADGAYTVEMSASEGTNTDTDTVNFTIKNLANTVTVDVTSATVSGNTNFDPSTQGGSNDKLNLTYTLSGAIGSSQAVADLVIKDADGREVQSFATTDTLLTATFTWDGKNKLTNKLVGPGTYKASLSVTGGPVTFTDETTFQVAYSNSNAPDISGFSVTPSSFDPQAGETVIKFDNASNTNYTIEIWGSNNLTETTIINDKTYSTSTVELTWDGAGSNGNDLSDGAYKVVLTAINDYGVAVEKLNLTLVDITSDIPASNAHISNISCKPSATFEPAEDDEITCEFDALVDLDEVIVYAIRGSKKIEIEDFGSLNEEDAVEFTWDGTEDGDEQYAEKGTWLIQIQSKLSNTTLVAGKFIDIDYQEAKIDEFFLTKEDLDPDQGDTTYAVFKVDEDAEIDLEILEGNDLDDTVEEDFEVEKDQWYAIEVDLGDYDKNDDVDIRLVVKNIANTAIQNSEKIAVDINEDKDSSSKAEIHADIISPVISNGEGDFELSFETDDDADVTVSIHKGKSSSGTTQIELMDEDDVDAGDFSICWNGLDEDGNRLSDGFYTYKIVTRANSSETKLGTFLIDSDIGEIVGGADSGCGGSNNDDDDDNDNGSGSVCAGFSDVASLSSYCDAISWAKNEGIFQGYSDGTFKPFQPINRVEVLKVVLEAQGVSILSDDFTTQGFLDVLTGSWYMQYIRTGKQLGIFNGDAGRSTARPDATVNRAEALKFIFETLRVSNGFNVGSCSTAHSDVNAGVWYYNYSCQAKTYNLFDGGNFLNPEALSTRGEVAQVLYDLNKAGLF